MDLSKDLVIAVRIYEYNLLDEPVWFARLVKEFEDAGIMSRATVAKYTRKLLFFGIIGDEWVNIDGKWVRTFAIDENALSLIESIAEKYPSSLGQPKKGELPQKAEATLL